MPRPALPNPKTVYFVAIYGDEGWAIGDEPMSFDQAKWVVGHYQAQGVDVNIIETLHRVVYQGVGAPDGSDDGERMVA